MKKTIIALLCLFVGSTSFAQVILNGQVVDSATSSVLPFCIINADKETVVSDAKGQFTLKLSQPKTLEIDFQYLGEFYHTELEVKADTFVVFQLAISAEKIEAVEVHAHEHKPDKVVALSVQLSKIQLESKSAITLGDALVDVNGVSFLKTGNSIAKPILQGMHSNRILIINAGSRLENQQWGTEHAPSLDPLNGSSMEVLKGASTLLYGNDAIGGVVRILPGEFSETNYYHLKMFSRIQSNGLGGQLGLQFERYDSALEWGNRLTVNFRKVGDAYTPDYVLSNTANSQASLSYYSHLHIGKHLLSLNLSSFNQLLGILEASHIGNQSDLNRALASDTPLIIRPYSFNLNAPYQKVEHHSAQLIWELLHLPLGNLRATLTQQLNRRQEFDKHGGGDLAALTLHLNTTQLNVLIDKHIDRWRVEYGALAERQQNTYEGRYFIPNYLRYKMGVFAVSTYEQEKSLFELGLRYDQMNNSTFRYENAKLLNEHFTFSGFSISLGMQQLLAKHLKLKLGASRKFRAPEVNELFSNGLHHGSAALEFGDLTLDEEIAYSFNLGLSYGGKKWRWDFEPYIHYFNGFINLEPTNETQLSIRGAFPVFRYKQTEVLYSGLDAGATFTANANWQLASRFNFVYAKNIESSSFVYGVPAPSFHLNAKRTIYSSSFFRNTYVMLKSNYVFRHSWAELEHDFAAPPDAYLLLGFEFGKHLSEKPGVLVFQINNILNSNYRDYMNRYRYFASEQGIQFNLTFNYTLNKTQK